MQNIKKIGVLETYSVRHSVLRKGKPIASCRFDGDDLTTTHHFGYFLNNEIVGIISIFKNNNIIFANENQCQIRGMAVLNEHQKKGIGETLILFSEDFIKKMSVRIIWFNARTSAVGFYKKLDYQINGVPFEIEGVGEHSLMFKKIRYE
jgi:ribosomal protein S18 acetylase RimI-like enzyme